MRRGPIDVKGKGGMVTYFVDKKVSGEEHHNVKVDRTLSETQYGSTISDKKGFARSTRIPSEPECEVRVTVTS